MAPRQIDTSRLGMVQALRAIAALTVVFGHAQTEALSLVAAKAGGLSTFLVDKTGAGVDLFFVISGFVMVHASQRLFGEAGAAKTFLLRRLFRIVPLYWAVTTLFLLAMLATPALLSSDAPTLVEIVKSYLFVPYAKAGAEMMQPVYKLGWTLNYEMFFYGLFGLVIWMPLDRAVAGLAALLEVGQMRDRPGTHTLGFLIGPRINAAGRIDETHPPRPDEGLGHRGGFHHLGQVRNGLDRRVVAGRLAQILVRQGLGDAGHADRLTTQSAAEFLHRLDEVGLRQAGQVGRLRMSRAVWLMAGAASETAVARSIAHDRRHGNMAVREPIDGGIQSVQLLLRIVLAAALDRLQALDGRRRGLVHDRTGDGKGPQQVLACGRLRERRNRGRRRKQTQQEGFTQAFHHHCPVTARPRQRRAIFLAARRAAVRHLIRRSDGENLTLQRYVDVASASGPPNSVCLKEAPPISCR